MTQYNFKYYLLTVFAWLTLQQVKSQHLKENFVDSSNCMITYQCSQIFFDQAVSERAFWIEMLAKDSLFISTIRKPWNLGCIQVKILEIVVSGPSTYQFESAITQVPCGQDSFGLARRYPGYYQVRIGKLSNGTKFIVDVREGARKQKKRHEF